MGILLLSYSFQATSLHPGLLGGLLVSAGFSRLIVSARRRHKGQPGIYWFLLSSIRDILFGFTILSRLDASLTAVANRLALWAVIYAFLQSAETLVYFLGSPSDAQKSYWVKGLHVMSVLLAGGFAYILSPGPDEQPTALRFGSLFLIGLGIAQGLLTQQLRSGTT